jgi:hypothetical protein
MVLALGTATLRLSLIEKLTFTNCNGLWGRARSCWGGQQATVAVVALAYVATYRPQPAHAKRPDILFFGDIFLKTLLYYKIIILKL